MKKNVFEKHPKKTVLFTIIFLSSLSICILQLISYLMISSFLKNPEIIKNSKIIKPTIQKLYMSYDRNIIQYLDYAAQYDQELMYILKPGNFTVKNREHSSIYSINKLGFRDDEKSLTKPSIVVIGDSHSMGWGVQQNETFAHLVEKQLNKTVLNTGVSSYGTARESIALRRVDTSNLKYLIIQYCLNDFSENKDFVNNNYNLFISPKESYLNIVKGHMDRDRRPYLSIQIMAQIILDKILATPIEDIERKKKEKIEMKK